MKKKSITTDDAFKLALNLHQSGRLDEAESIYERILCVQPARADTLHLKGLCRYQRGDYESAARLVGASLQSQPGNAVILNNFGAILLEQNKKEEALQSFERAIALKPDYIEAHSNHGKALKELRRFEAALASYQMAINLNPDFVQAYIDAGNILYELERYSEALSFYDKAIVLSPGNAEAFDNRGSVLRKLGRLNEAIASLEKALELDPDLPYTLGQWIYVKLLVCDWSGLAEAFARIGRMIDSGKKVSPSFYVLAMPLSAEQQLQSARIYIQDKFPLDRDSHWRGDRYEHKRIRLGYFSSDFGDHPVSYLTAGLFEHHDRSRFEVIAFFTGKPSGDGIQQRLRKVFDQFIDVEERSDREVAQLAKEMEIDIAVDMNGHTSGARTGVFALRPAPIQVNYLGYPGTLGAEYMDYIIADRTVIPAEHQSYYMEHVVYLPHCFQVNDATKAITEPGFSRSELGLPEQGFVFCCFNNNYKLTPDLFEVWMRLLKQVQGSVLWLQGGNSTVVANLRREAEQHGVSPDRLIFASRMEKLADHLARHRQADLFLDTLYYNAHTTASDALWAGLPVLTCLGKTYASRVAASLLEAIGLPELITHSLQEYEALALALATDPDRLAATKEKLARHRTTYPLFDTALFTKHIEAAYSIMWERYQKGLPAETIYIET